jgi:hypothetical protein
MIAAYKRQPVFCSGSGAYVLADESVDAAVSNNMNLPNGFNLHIFSTAGKNKGRHGVVQSSYTC